MIIIDYSQKVKTYIRKDLINIMRILVKNIIKEMRILMKMPKSGRVYRKPSGRKHIASAPGQAPAIWTGRLSKSLDQEVFTKGNINTGVIIVGRVGTSARDKDVQYPKILEFGSNKIARRPFFQPTFERAKVILLEVLERYKTGKYPNIPLGSGKMFSQSISPRTIFYKSGKLLGDITAITGIGFGFRKQFYQMGRTLGDISAFQRAGIAQRMRFRAEGKIAKRASGVLGRSRIGKRLSGKVTGKLF